MKIAMDNLTNQAIKEYSSVMDSVKSVKIEGSLVASYNRGGIFTDGAYSEHNKNMSDVMQEAGQVDITTQRNLMTVMSNTMSGEDYKKAMEDGFDLADMNGEKAVTIVDHIKAVMAQSGNVVAGYNDDLDSDRLVEITGSQAAANQLKNKLESADLPASNDIAKRIHEAKELLSDVDGLSEASIKYMVDNEMLPTIENIYTAKFSASGDGSKQARGYYSEGMGGYMSRKADEINWPEIEPQLKASIKQMQLGDMSYEVAMDRAKWLLEKGLPVEESKIIALDNISRISFPIPDDVIGEVCIRAIGEGKQAKEANLSPNYVTIFNQANLLMEQTEEITDEDLKSCIKSGKQLTIKNLYYSEGKKEATGSMASSHSRSMSSQVSSSGQDVTNIQLTENEELTLVSARRNLEEIRLRMTLDINISLLRQGKELDTQPLSELVDTLREKEQDLMKQFLGNGDVKELDAKAAIYKESRDVLSEIPSLPAATIGRLKLENNTFTLRSVHEAGNQLKADFHLIENRYETLMTAPRKDLGDSIAKAFRNIDDILKSIGLDTSAQNERAVRILGYNGMEITPDSVKKIRVADEKLAQTVKALTPAKTLQLIRDGINPLDMSVDELKSKLDEYGSNSMQDNEKYARFLYKLEQSNGITDAEKDSYIGIYRMLNTLEKNDHAALGALLDSGARITFGNLVTAVRSGRTSIDSKIDNNFGFLKDVVKRGTSITDQVETAFKNRVGAEKFEELDRRYEDHSMDDLRQRAGTASEGTIEALLDNNMEVSINNLEAFERFVLEQNSFFRSMDLYSKRVDSRRSVLSTVNSESELVDKMEEVLASFTDKESAQESVNELSNTMNNILSSMSEAVAESVLDYRGINLMHKQLSLMTRMANEENYHIPVILKGQLTDINVRLVHGNEKGHVSVDLDTEEFGQIRGEFQVEQDRVGLVLTGKDGKDLSGFKEIEEGIKEKIGDLGFGEVNITYITGNPRFRHKFTAEKADNNNEGVDSSRLYKVAKTFVEVLVG